MDLLTQGLLGGVLAQSVAGKDDRRLATLAGVSAGLLADADVLIGSAGDPLLSLEYHRHFTHALVFVPFGAAIALALLWPFLRGRVPGARLYLYCLAGYALSGFLDACTSYGTHLLWPFSDERVAFNIISIVDPAFTGVLLAALVLGLRRPGRAAARAGLGLAAAYLLLGLTQLQRAEAVAAELAAARGHAPTRQVVKPTLGNLVLWRSVYEHDGRIHVDAVRVGLPGAQVVFPGGSLARLDLARDLPGLDPASTLHRDVTRFAAFSDGYVALVPELENVIGDLRYSMLPASTRPLWGLVIDPGRPEVHGQYRFFREQTPELRRTFFNMLRGRCAEPAC